MIKLFIISILLISSSCSTNWNKFFANEEDTLKRNEKLMKDFKVDKKVLEKFETTEIPQEPKIKESPKIKKSVEVKKLKSKTKVITTKKIVKKLYPNGYPENLKELSKKTKKTFESFTPTLNINEKMYMDINYLGVSTGKIVITTMPKTVISKKEVFHFNARMQTSRYYSYLYELDDQIDSYVTTDSFIPLKFSLIQRESGQDVDDLQLFDLDAKKGFKFYKRVTEKKTRKRQGEFFLTDYFQDPLSLTYFLRGLEYKKGTEYLIPFYNKGELKTFKVKVLGTETISTNIGKKKAFKLRASSDYTGDTIKSGDMTFWFSNDKDRVFLKFEAKIKIGSISGDIEKYTK